MKRTWRNILLTLVVALAGMVLAAGTPADTEITNQASASFNDSAGQARTTTSNQVVTIVQQIAGVAIAPLSPNEASPGQIKHALPGASAYFNYALENAGNSLDTFTFLVVDGGNDDTDFTGTDSVYHDENCNGTVDSGEADVTSVGMALAADEEACVIVRATIDSAASNDNTLNLNFTATSGVDGAVNANSWAQAIAATGASLDINLERTPSGTVTNGTAISYQFSGSNLGGSTAHSLTMTDVLAGAKNDNVIGVQGIVATSPVPAGTAFASVSGTAGAGDGVQFLYFDTSPATDEWTTVKPADADIAQVAMVINKPSGNTGFFPQGASFEMTLGVTVDNSLAVSSNITNSGTITYSTNGTLQLDSSSNTVSNAQAQSHAVTLTPGSAFTDWPVTVVGNDQTLSGSVVTGDTVLFMNTLTNAGTTEDSFGLALSSPPTDWTCGFRQADGATPLSGAVGPLPAGGTHDFSLACKIGPEATTGSETDLVITATSAASAAASASATNTVPTVTSGYAVTFESAGDGNIARVDATGASTTASIDPGGSFYIPLEVTNAGDSADVFALSFSGLPTGWTLVIHEDEDELGACDQVANNSPTASTEILTNAQSQCFVAVGTVPTTETSGDKAAALTFTASSTNDSGVSASVVNAGTAFPIAEVNVVTVDPDRSGTVTAPGTISYQLNVHNGGNDDQTISLSSSAGSYGWTYQLSTDDGASWGATPSVLVPAGETRQLKVRVIVPAGEPVGRVDTVAITGTDGTASDSASISTTVVGGDLTLENSARTCSDAVCSGDPVNNGTEAEPGEYIEYTLVASNIGTADISEVIVMVPLPNFTNFESVSAITTVQSGTTPALLYSADGSTWSSSAAGITPSAGSAVYVGVDTDDDGPPATIGTGDLMEPAATITVTLVVQVK